MQIEIFDAKSEKLLTTLNSISQNEKIYKIKQQIHNKKSHLYPDRQSLRVEPRGKSLKDEDPLSTLKLPSVGARLYIRDLGPQIAWKTVFLLEYFGPFVIYPTFYFRPSFIYGSSEAAIPTVVQYEILNGIHHHEERGKPGNVSLACICYTFHFGKRLLETLFIHRFSHATMPYLNLFKNCGYYWGFSAFISYYGNHPLYTEPSFGLAQIGVGLVGFVLAELGNFSIHLALRNLRPEGSKERKIPIPTGNPFTLLFNFVSCPNYTYEVAAWLSFSIMTQSMPALIFTVFGFAQMAIWAIGKHKGYKKEFSNYPRGRKAIIPFLL